ncbi:hypothetical protein ABVK25_001027 [Lepraria finkii]|uniref:Uncharacterized protein n=1 Tax=Lepraria finkii TaxID=1340010 RepID=A0ABR4BKF9_9LECA
MRLPIQAATPALAVFTVSTTTLPTFSGARNALTSLVSHIKRSPQPPPGNFDMDPLNDDEMDAAMATWGIDDDLGLSDTPISDATPLAAPCC